MPHQVLHPIQSQQQDCSKSKPLWLVGLFSRVGVRRSFSLPFWSLRLLAKLILWAFRFEIRGAAHLPKDGPIILAGNHAGLLDSLMVLAAVPFPFHFLMAEEVLSWPVIGGLVPYANTLMLPREGKARVLASVIRRLKNGESICIFPEGKLTLDGHLNPFNEGVAFLQEKSGAMIVPFALHGGFEAWPYGGGPVLRKVVLEFGHPIPATAMATKHENPDRATITRLLYTRVHHLLETEALKRTGQIAKKKPAF